MFVHNEDQMDQDKKAFHGRCDIGVRPNGRSGLEARDPKIDKVDCSERNTEALCHKKTNGKLSGCQWISLNKTLGDNKDWQKKVDAPKVLKQMSIEGRIRALKDGKFDNKEFNNEGVVYTPLPKESKAVDNEVQQTCASLSVSCGNSQKKADFAGIVIKNAKGLSEEDKKNLCCDADRWSSWLTFSIPFNMLRSNPSTGSMVAAPLNSAGAPIVAQTLQGKTKVKPSATGSESCGLKKKSTKQKIISKTQKKQQANVLANKLSCHH